MLRIVNMVLGRYHILGHLDPGGGASLTNIRSQTSNIATVSDTPIVCQNEIGQYVQAFRSIHCPNLEFCHEIIFVFMVWYRIWEGTYLVVARKIPWLIQGVAS